MAITKLMHMKEAKTGNPAVHLKNSLKYIFRSEKTQDGLYIGGCADTAQGAYQQFLETKKECGKLHGRQGYHFVINFGYGMASVEKACTIMDEFCREYLGNDFDYVWTVHTDKEHLHGHIIFNSVSRTTGLKYHYKKGDWEKSVQPVTNRLCMKHGLPPLEFEEEKKNKNYAQWEREKKACMTQRDLLCSDIDDAIEQAEDYEEFHKIMESLGYQMRTSNSKKHGEYLSFRPESAKKAYRSYTLKNGYDLPDICRRIQEKEQKPSYVKVPTVIRCVGVWHYRKLYTTSAQIKKIKKHYQNSILGLYQNATARPRDIKMVHTILEECDWMAAAGIGQNTTLEEALQKLTAQEDALIRIQEHTYQKLRRIVSEEGALDQIPESELHKAYWEGKNNLNKLSQKLRIVRKEKQIAQRIQQKQQRQLRHE